jgi:hypothetical protein
VQEGGDEAEADHHPVVHGPHRRVRTPVTVFPTIQYVPNTSHEQGPGAGNFSIFSTNKMGSF